MSYFTVRQYSKNSFIIILLVVACIAATDIAVARSKPKSAPIQIVWSNSSETIAIYTVSPGKPGHVKVQMIVARNTETDTKPWAGGIDSLLTVAEMASKEASKMHSQAAKGTFWRRLKVSYKPRTAWRSFSLEGEMNELLAFFNRTTDLKSLLRLVSADAPKAYRLINEGERAVMPPRRVVSKSRHHDFNRQLM